MTNPQLPTHERLNLKNFTAFADQTFEFVPGLNVLVGENGTGKTHVMKALYAWQLARHLADTGQEADYAWVFAETYGAKAVGELQRSKTAPRMLQESSAPTLGRSAFSKTSLLITTTAHARTSPGLSLFPPSK